MRGAAITAIVALCVTGCSPELNWRQLDTAESGVSQLFPCRPIRQQRRVDIADRPRTMVLYVCDAGMASWAQASCDATGAEDGARVRDALWRALHANLGIPVEAAGPVPDGPRRLNGQAPDGRELQAAVLFVAGPSRVVQVTVVGPTVPFDESVGYLGSVKVKP